MSAKETPVKIDLEELKKRRDDHASRCAKIAEEVNKWGKKSKPDLSFLKAN